jgi:predicted nucleic acid-binding protein
MVRPMPSSAFLHDASGVVLDACVLYPPILRDTLLRAAEEGLYQVHWNSEILEELRRNLIADAGLTETGARDLIDAMTAFFPEAEVTGYESLLFAMTNDQKDRHVLAAAVRASAQIIVTDNIRDFPASALDPFNIESQTPDIFLTHLVYLYPDVMVQIVQEQAADYRHPPRTVDDILTRLARRAPTFVRQVRARMNNEP